MSYLRRREGLLASAFLLLLCSSTNAILCCSRGQRIYLDGPDPAKDHCHPCKEGTYQDKRCHRSTFCEDCKVPNYHSSFYKPTANCTRFSNTQNVCKGHGYFFNTTIYDCVRCNKCPGQFVAVNCSRYRDAQCCPRRDMSIRDGRCTTRCGIGEYFKDSTCLRCPPNKTNYDTVHFKPDCFERCFSGWNDDIKEREECQTGEINLGRSCHNKSLSLCLQSDTGVDLHDSTEKTVKCETEENTEKSQANKQTVGLTSIVFTAITVVLSIQFWPQL